MIILSDERFKKAACRLWKGIKNYNHDTERSTIVTPIGGRYGLWGYAMVLNGSPDHGYIIFDISRKTVRFIKLGKIRTHRERFGVTTGYDHVMEFLTSIGVNTVCGGDFSEPIEILGE